MNKEKKDASSGQKQVFPDWYWQYGLHDACITHIEQYDFPADYNIYYGRKNSCYRNLFRLQIDASNALGDTDIKEIRLFNYEILSRDMKWQLHKKIWWLGDSLTESDDKYLLEIDLQDFDSWPEEFTLIVKFEFAEVDRRDFDNK